MTLALIASILAFGSYGGLLVLLFRSGPSDRARRLFLLYLLVMMLLQATYLMISLAKTGQTALFGYMFNIPLALGQVCIYYFFTRAFLQKDSPRTLVLGGVLFWMVIVVIGIALHPYVIPAIYRDPYTGLFVPEIGSLAPVLSIPVLSMLGATIFELVREYRRTFHLQKVRIQYLLLAIVFVWVGMLANGFAALRAYPIDVTANIVSALLIALAILRYQLLDINIVIRRGLVYSVSVLIMGVGYFIAVFFLTRLFVLDQPASLLISIVAAVIVVGILTPLRDRAQLLLDRALFREKYDGMAMIQRLSDTAASMLDLDKLAHTILDDMAGTMHIQWAVLSLKQEKCFLPVASKGLQVEGDYLICEDHPVLAGPAHRPGIVTANDMVQMLALGKLSQQQYNEMKHHGIQMLIPLKTRDGLVGVFILGPKRSGQAYSPDDETILATLANHVAAAVDNARLYDAVQHELNEREKLIKQLQATNAELESFTYTVSHDLKAPLITINGFLNFLREDAEAGNAERVGADILRITEATSKMHRLLNELLELSRIGRLVNPATTMNFESLVSEVRQLAAGRLAARQVQVVVAPDLPAIHGDRQRLVQVLQNLIDNAAKFMGDQPKPRIEIGQHGEENGMPIFYVKDNGIGIAPEYHQRIFGLFNKLDPTREGTGVGLALVKRIVEVHGGRIWLESEPDQGATFFFTLPLAEG